MLYSIIKASQKSTKKNEHNSTAIQKLIGIIYMISYTQDKPDNGCIYTCKYISISADYSHENDCMELNTVSVVSFYFAA